MAYESDAILNVGHSKWLFLYFPVPQGVKTAMKDYAKKQHRQIDELVVQIRSKLGKNDRSKYNTVLIIDVHARDIIDGFVRDRWETVERLDWSLI